MPGSVCPYHTQGLDSFARGCIFIQYPRRVSVPRYAPARVHCTRYNQSTHVVSRCLAMPGARAYSPHVVVSHVTTYAPRPRARYTRPGIIFLRLLMILNFTKWSSLYNHAPWECLNFPVIFITGIFSMGNNPFSRHFLNRQTILKKVADSTYPLPTDSTRHNPHAKMLTNPHGILSAGPDPDPLLIVYQHANMVHLTFQILRVKPVIKMLVKSPISHRIFSCTKKNP